MRSLLILSLLSFLSVQEGQGSTKLSWDQCNLLPIHLDPVDSISSLSSQWGGQNFNETVVPSLDYTSFGYIDATKANAIRTFTEQLKVPHDHLILFRGQKDLSPPTKMPQNKAEWSQFIITHMQVAISYRNQKLANHLNHESLSRTLGSKSLENWKRWTAWYESATALDSLIWSHQESYGSPLVVSCTRHLGVAAGDYNMRRIENRNRYIYILSAPKQALLNIHATNIAEKDAIGAALKAEDTHGEQEISVWLDARPYVVGIYDGLEGRFILQNSN